MKHKGRRILSLYANFYFLSFKRRIGREVNVICIMHASALRKRKLMKRKKTYLLSSSHAYRDKEYLSRIMAEVA